MEEFYGVEVAVDKIVKPRIPAEHVLRITQVALPPGATHPITFYVKTGDKASYVVANLDPKKAIYHLGLDLLVACTQEDVTFTCSGAAGTVHLTGYTQLAADPALLDDEDEEDDYLGEEDDEGDFYNAGLNSEEEEEEEEAPPRKLPKGEKKKMAGGKKKK